jgi:predicted dinucleotide-binding enzyme
MRIGIIGTGQMAAALGGGWARAGHDVLFGGRSPGRAAELAERTGPGCRGGDPREAAEFGEAVLLAVPADAVADALARAGAADGALAGRALIDCTNAFAPGAFQAAPDSFVLAEDAMAERVARLAAGARVVKAFNVCAAEVWASDLPLSVPLCGDDPEAVDTVATLVKDLGFHPIPAGRLDRARHLEATAVFVIGLWFAGHDARTMLPPLEAAFATPA